MASLCNLHSACRNMQSKQIWFFFIPFQDGRPWWDLSFYFALNQSWQEIDPRSHFRVFSMIKHLHCLSLFSMFAYSVAPQKTTRRMFKKVTFWDGYHFQWERERQSVLWEGGSYPETLREFDWWILAEFCQLRDRNGEKRERNGNEFEWNEKLLLQGKRHVNIIAHNSWSGVFCSSHSDYSTWKHMLHSCRQQMITIC